MTTVEIAWAAGLLEGEGSFGFYGKPPNPRVWIGMGDEDVIDRFRNLFGISSKIHRKKPNQHSTQTCFVCSTSGWKAASIMMTVYSFMGARRRGKIKETLVNWRSKPQRMPRGFGRKREI